MRKSTNKPSVTLRKTARKFNLVHVCSLLILQTDLNEDQTNLKTNEQHIITRSCILRKLPINIKTEYIFRFLTYSECFVKYMWNVSMED